MLIYVLFVFSVASGLMGTSVASVQSEKAKGQNSASHSAKAAARSQKRSSSQRSTGQSYSQKHWLGEEHHQNSLSIGCMDNILSVLCRMLSGFPEIVMNDSLVLKCKHDSLDKALR